MKKFLKFILFLIGFPALLAFVAWKSLTVLEEGATYTFWPYVGIILAGVFFIAYFITFLVTGRKAKKNAGNRKKVMAQVVTLMIVAFVFTAGIWIVVDIPLPDILSDATSGTITFDKLREDYDDQAEQNGLLIDNFVKWNYENGNLNQDVTLDEWLERGWSDPAVQDLISVNFKSMDQNGYATFRGPWINLADDDRLTIPVLVHLIINKREFNEELDFILNYEMYPNLVKTEGNPSDYVDELRPLTDEEKELLVKWSILDMQGTPMNIELALGSIVINEETGETVGDLIGSLKDVLGGAFESIATQLVPVLTVLNDAVASDALAGTPIYIGLDLTEFLETGNLGLNISSTVQARGMWDYKKSAWLNSNHLLFAVISVFPARQWLYIWGAVVIFASLAIGAIRLKEYGGAAEDTRTKDDVIPADREEAYNAIDYSAIDAEATKGMSPYERTYYYAYKRRTRVE